ncbi:MAG: succinate dehydrogenase [Bradymonadaceae bacterium]
MLVGLSLFIVYSTWAAFQAEYYWADPYLSPFYAPPLFIPPGCAEAAEALKGCAPEGHAWLAESYYWPSWWPSWVPQSPSFLILLFPLAFRFTCYYYRKAYYRAFTWSPPTCAVQGVPQDDYKGETRFLLFQNLHRYAMYVALLFIVILSYDAAMSFYHHKHGFGIGLGSIIMTLNVVFIALYTFGCHSIRHLIGGRLDCFSCHAAAEMQHDAWSWQTLLNRKHMLWAWISLYWMAFTDAYVRLCSMGVIQDINTWGSTWVGS